MKTLKVYGDHDKIRGKFTVKAVGQEPGYLVDEMEVHFMKGSRRPVIGETLSIWQDGSTSYAIAPNCS